MSVCSARRPSSKRDFLMSFIALSKRTLSGSAVEPAAGAFAVVFFPKQPQTARAAAIETASHRRPRYTLPLVLAKFIDKSPKRLDSLGKCFAGMLQQRSHRGRRIGCTENRC